MNMEERLSNLITDNILPRLIPELEMLPCAVPTCWRCTCIRAPVGLITSSVQVLNAVSMCVSAPPIVMPTRNCLRSYGVLPVVKPVAQEAIRALFLGVPSRSSPFCVAVPSKQVLIR